MDKKFLEYKIIRKEAQFGALEKEINELLARNEGWVPLGNVSAVVKVETVGMAGQVVEYIQAVAKLEK